MKVEVEVEVLAEVEVVRVEGEKRGGESSSFLSKSNSSSVLFPLRPKE